MRSSPVAPAPPPNRTQGGGTDDGSRRGNKSFSNQSSVEATPILASATEIMSSPVNDVSTTSPPPPPLQASSVSMEDDTVNEDEDVGFDYDDDDDDDDLLMEDDDDPYTYSDDSASLNDAYFLQPPHDSSYGSSNGGLFGLMSDTESEKDPLESPVPATNTFGMDVFPPHNNKTRRGKRNRIIGGRSDHERRNGSVSSISSPIDEEEPMTESTSLLRNHKEARQINNHHTGVITFAHQGTKSASSYRNRQERKRRKMRKQQRDLRLQQFHQQLQKQQDRERAVTQIRGQPQPVTQTDRVWLILFIAQLLYVSLCALKYGLSLKSPSITTVTTPDGSMASIARMNEKKHSALPMAKVMDSMHPVNTKMVQLPVPENDTDDVVSVPWSEHLQDNDNVQPAIQDDRQQYLRSRSNPVSSTNSSSSSGTTTMTSTTTEDGTSVIVVENAQFTVDYKNVLSLLLISGLYACVISYLSFAFMLMVARSLIPIMLVFTIMLLLCWGVVGLTVNTYGGSAISILGFSMFGLSVAYTMVSWNRIPFCSTNLYTAICALRSSVMTLLAGVMSLFVALLWLFIWSIAVMGILNMENGTDCAIWDDCGTHIVIGKGRLMELGVLLLSLYWTTMVIKNIVRVTVADAIGCWWMQSDGTLFEPLVRACTTSLGTICFGSLVAFPAQTLSVLGGCFCWASGGVANQTVHWSSTPTKRMSTSSEYNSTPDTEPEDSSIKQQKVVNAVAKKIVQEKNCLHRFGRQLQACNRWSYTYVGMYNYSFIEGGKKAIKLFETREWMEIVRDNLIQNILLMASIVIGGSSAVVAVLVEEVDGYTFTSLNKPIVTSFWIGFILGFVLSNILLLGVVGSAVNTILVCFAAEPFQFDSNHPRLSREMREVWSQQVWEPDPEN